MKEYFDENGDPHREDGPAYEWENATKGWFIHGKMHREDGPAREWYNGDKDWWWKGNHVMKTKGPVTESQIKEFKLRRIS